MTGAEERARDNELFDEGRAEAADEWLSEAIHQYLRDGTLAELVELVAQACELRASLPKLMESTVQKWEAAGTALSMTATDDEIKNVP